MRGVHAETELSDVHRLSADEYHQLIESGGLDEDTRVELIDGLLVDMSPKSREHENVIAWLAALLIDGVDRQRYQVRVGAPLSLGASEPEPDLMVIEREAPRPYHPDTASLVVEVAVSSQGRDLRVKPRLYAEAGIPIYWVIDLDGRRAVAHSSPAAGGYEHVEVLAGHGSLDASSLGLPSIPLSDVLAAAV
jgi:Uma2 family endonuclease